MKRRPRNVLISLFFTANYILLPSSLALANTAPIIPQITEVDLKTSEAKSVQVKPQIETLTLDMSVLLPEENPEIFQPSHFEKRSKLSYLMIVPNMAKKIILFEWVGDLKRWFYKKPQKELSEKEEEIRLSWEEAVGFDVFHAYFKYEEVKDKVQQSSEFEIYDLQGKARFNILNRNVSLKFKKEL